MSRHRKQAGGAPADPPQSACMDSSGNVYSPTNVQPQQWAQLTQQMHGWNQMTPMIVFPQTTEQTSGNETDMIPQMFPLQRVQFPNAHSTGNAIFSTPSQLEFGSSLQMLSSVGAGSHPSQYLEFESSGRNYTSTSKTSKRKQKRARPTSAKEETTHTKETEVAEEKERKKARAYGPLPEVVEQRLEKGVEDKKGKKMTSKYPCVSWNRNARKWQAYMRIKGKRIHLGYYETEEEAASVVQKAKAERAQQMDSTSSEELKPKTTEKPKVQKTESKKTSTTTRTDDSANATSEGHPGLVDPVQVMAAFSNADFQQQLARADFTNV